MEKTCSKCGQNKCAQVNKDAEEDCSSDTLTNMFSKLIGIDMTKLSEGTNKSYRKSMTLTTLISVIMVMNIMQGSNMLQGGVDKAKTGSFSEFEKRTLQRASNIISEEGGLNELCLIEEVMPLLKKLEENYKPDQETETMDSHRNLIKLEDVGSKQQMKDFEFLAMALSKKHNGDMEEDLLLSEESLDKKSHGSTLFGRSTHELSLNEGKMHIEDEQDLEIKDLECEKTGFLESIGKLFQDNKKEGGLLSSWSKLFTGNSFGYH